MVTRNKHLQLATEILDQLWGIIIVKHQSAWSKVSTMTNPADCLSSHETLMERSMGAYFTEMEYVSWYFNQFDSHLADDAKQLSADDKDSTIGCLWYNLWLAIKDFNTKQGDVFVANISKLTLLEIGPIRYASILQRHPCDRCDDDPLP